MGEATLELSEKVLAPASNNKQLWQTEVSQTVLPSGETNYALIHSPVPHLLSNGCVYMLYNNLYDSKL